jgi:hypothetical protein
LGIESLWWCALTINELLTRRIGSEKEPISLHREPGMTQRLHRARDAMLR